jgi:hypothetical protein
MDQSRWQVRSSVNVWRRQKPSPDPHLAVISVSGLLILHSMSTKKRRLVEMLPGLSAELQRLLTERNEVELAAQVPDLNVVDRCRCGDDFCAMFYVLPMPEGVYGPQHRNVALTPKEGMLILDVVANKIAAVEVLYRDEIRQKLLTEFP